MSEPKKQTKPLVVCPNDGGPFAPSVKVRKDGSTVTRNECVRCGYVDTYTSKIEAGEPA